MVQMRAFYAGTLLFHSVMQVDGTGGRVDQVAESGWKSASAWNLRWSMIRIRSISSTQVLKARLEGVCQNPLNRPLQSADQPITLKTSARRAHGRMSCQAC